jgi:hypothetical protein
MKTDGVGEALAISDVQDGVEISPPVLKCRGHARDPAPKAPPVYVAVSASNLDQPFRINFPQSTFSPHRMIIPSHQITDSNMKKYLNAPPRKIIKANPMGRR